MVPRNAMLVRFAVDAVRRSLDRYPESHVRCHRAFHRRRANYVNMSPHQMYSGARYSSKSNRIRRTRWHGGTRLHALKKFRNLYKALDGAH